MNENLGRVKISGIRRFFNEVSKVDDAISLTLGQPDFEVPEIIKNAMIKAIEEGKTTYTANSGILELRKEISKYLYSKEIEYNEDDICITVGGSEGIFSIFTSLINEGDEVLIPTPAYPAYESIVTILGGKIVNYSLDSKMKIDVDNLEKIIKERKIRYLVLSMPSNPTGTILSKEERDRIIGLINENDIIVITDEIYESLCYGDYYSVAQNNKILDKVIYISGFSKMFSSTGLRVGYVACKNKVMNEFMKVHQYNVSCATSIAQYGVYEGLKYGLGEVEKMKDTFDKRRQYVVNRLKAMSLDVVNPQGAFYLFPSIKEFGLSSEEFCKKLLFEGKVACVPGSAFGEGGEGYIRISYCYSDEELKEGLDRLESYILKLKKLLQN